MENELESPQAGAAGHLVCSEPGSRGYSVGGSFGPFVTPKRSARCRIPALLLSVSLPLFATWVQRRGRVAQVAAAAPGPPEWSPRRLRTRRPGGGALLQRARPRRAHGCGLVSARQATGQKRERRSARVSRLAPLGRRNRRCTPFLVERVGGVEGGGCRRG